MAESSVKSTLDSFANFMQRLGGAPSPTGLPGFAGGGPWGPALNTGQGATYQYNPISKQQFLLEQLYRGSWLIGKAVDKPAEDMTREGVRFTGTLKPDVIQKLMAEDLRLGTWEKLKDGIAWGRLYGGAVVVPLIDGANVAAPLDIDRVRRDSYKGLCVFDRWMVDPITTGLVTELGPDLGKPEFYRVTSRAPVYVNSRVHYSRAIRFDGVRLPYQQRLIENEWSMSVVERIYDSIVSYDGVTAGASALVNKAHLRTWAVEGLRDIIAQGSAPGGGALYEALLKNMGMVAFYQGIQGITLMDTSDKFETHQYAFGGLADIMLQFAMQASGGLDVPMVVLFGQSPTGMSATGESDFRQYYDKIRRDQTNGPLYAGCLKHYNIMAKSLGIRLPDDFGIRFPPLWVMSSSEKGTAAKDVASTIGDMFDKGIISQRMALQELKQQSTETGIFTNITDEDIESADDTLLPPMPEGMLPGGEPAAGGGEEIDPPEDIDGEKNTQAPKQQTKPKPRPRPKVTDE